MLRSLIIRDIVLIEALELDFQPGLNVLTGETGAGKSILMDALGFALGRKVRRDLLRAGADRGSVTACFDVPEDHPAWAFMDEAGLDPAPEVILRRTTARDGPSRSFVNDVRVSAEVLARIGETLVEVHGQHDDRGLLNPRAHRPLLDAFAGIDVTEVGSAWKAWQSAERRLEEARAALTKAAADEDYLRHAVKELDRLSPEAGEDTLLDAERRLIQQAGRLTEEISRAAQSLSEGVTHGLSDALSRLTHVAERAEGRLEGAISAIDRCMAELADAEAEVARVLDDLTFDPGRLELVEERLFALRALARKHSVMPDDLPALSATLSERLAAIDAGEGHLVALETEARQHEQAYYGLAQAMTQLRSAAAQTLDKAITEELTPLKMEAARFLTEIDQCAPGPEGVDQVRFTASINPGAPSGPIDRIASGGELSRFLLALKVRLSARAGGLSMIFDEIDRGVGGATADAVGRRLLRLAASGQVLVVTHSPQVAALGQHHWRIRKGASDGVARTEVALLSADERRDEVARMLAGDTVTDAARTAADALIEAGE